MISVRQGYATLSPPSKLLEGLIAAKRIRHDGNPILRWCFANCEVQTDAACGDGPVDAIYNTIERVTGIAARLTDYEIHAVTGGKDAQGEVSLALEIEKRTVRGRGVSTDILEASAKAFVNAVNVYLFQTGEAEKK